MNQILCIHLLIPQAKCIAFDAYLMLCVEEIFESIGTANIISALDIANGYWQTYFWVPHQGKRQSSGLHLVCSSLKSCLLGCAVHQQHSKGSWTACYKNVSTMWRHIDDIVIFSQSWEEEHLRHLEEVIFQCLRSTNLHVKLKKCCFGHQKVHYLGHTIRQGAIEPDENNFTAINNYDSYHKDECLCILGSCGAYTIYQQFVPNFVTIAAPPSNLTRKDFRGKLFGRMNVKQLLCSLREPSWKN